MAHNNSILTLDEWKEFFCHANGDIFEVIAGAIHVAAAECPNELKTRRGEIIETLYARVPSKYCARTETIHGLIEDRGSNAIGIKDVKSYDDANGGLASCDESKTQPTPDKLNNSERTFLEESKIVGEIVRIKRVLTKWKSKSGKKIRKSLNRLKLLKLSTTAFSVRINKVTEIGKAVDELRKHKSGRIQKLARELIE